MSTPYYRFPTGKEVTRIPQLASSPLQFNLGEELQHLRAQVSWHRSTGRSSKTLVKYPDFHLVLVLMKANTRMNRHHVDGRFSIQALQGRIRVRIGEESIEVSAGEMVVLDYGISHEVEALDESAFLLTSPGPAAQRKNDTRGIKACRDGATLPDQPRPERRLSDHP